MKLENKIIQLMESASNDTLEVALCCSEQNIDDFIGAYYEVIMHNLNLQEVKKWMQNHKSRIGELMSVNQKQR